jgi:hypothetical protein
MLGADEVAGRVAGWVRRLLADTTLSDPASTVLQATDVGS